MNVSVVLVCRIKQCVRVIREVSSGECVCNDRHGSSTSCQILKEVPPPEHSRESDRGLCCAERLRAASCALKCVVARLCELT